MLPAGPARCRFRADVAWQDYPSHSRAGDSAILLNETNALVSHRERWALRGLQLYMLNTPLDDPDTRAAVCRALAIAEGDDGQAAAYWLHLCEEERVWSLRHERNGTTVVAEWDTIERADDDRIDFFGDMVPPCHKALWLADAETPAEALVAIAHSRAEVTP